jgi:heat shock protein HtpX
MNIYEQQQANIRHTWMVIGVFILLYAFIGLGFDYFYLGFDPFRDASRFDPSDAASAASFPWASSIALLFGGGQTWWSMRFGDQAVLNATGAKLVSPSTTDPVERQLLNVVEEMKIASGLPMPKVYIIPDPDPNAFATGMDAEHASVAATRGLIEKLNREELQGVMAHEMSHVRNLDIKLMTTVAALVGALALLSDWAGRTMRFGGGSSSSDSKRDSKGGGGAILIFAVWLVAVILAPFLAQMLAMAVSRQREYLADASGAELSRNPGALASALKKIEMDFAPTKSIRRGTAHLCIADPLGRKMDFREGFFADLLSTHPPMALRISKLMQMSYGSHASAAADIRPSAPAA